MTFSHYRASAVSHPMLKLEAAMSSASQFSILRHPYRSLHPISRGSPLRTLSKAAGAALVWRVEAASAFRAADWVASRPGGIALIAVLPRSDEIEANPRLIDMIQRCRPSGLLPDAAGHPHDLAQVLRRPPSDLAAEITDYLVWRGLLNDSETRQLLRRVFDLSTELRSITALCRGLYLSRRALGRRFMKAGLPVPSHWLQIARILRVVCRLQNSRESVFAVACDLGYPDGFSLSNQMQRMTGVRPTTAREFLGWEWLFEAWLRVEAERGGLTSPVQEEDAKIPTPSLHLSQQDLGGSRRRGQERV